MGVKESPVWDVCGVTGTSCGSKKEMRPVYRIRANEYTARVLVEVVEKKGKRRHWVKGHNQGGVGGVPSHREVKPVRNTRTSSQDGGEGCYKDVVKE